LHPLFLGRFIVARILRVAFLSGYVEFPNLNVRILRSNRNSCPLKKRKPSTWIAWENGPTGGVSSGKVIGVLLMANSCGYWVGEYGTYAAKNQRLQKK
jgi:hypothetical protein